MITTTLVPDPHLVVFGRDTAGKPHASWFDQANVALATKAAGLMNMHAVPVESDALRELAGSLPKGRIFSSGRAFTPFVAGKLYGQLVELTRDVLGLGEGEAATDAKAAAAEVKPTKATVAKLETTKARPNLQVVANKAEGAPQGDAPAPAQAPAPLPVPNEAAAVAGATTALRPSRVEDVGIGSLVLVTTGPAEGWWEAEVIGSNGSMLTLRWRDFHEPTVVRRRSELGFLPAQQS